MGWFDRFMDFVEEYFAPFLMVGMVLGIIVLIGVVVVGGISRLVNGPLPVIELQVNEWACVSEETYTYTTYVTSGKVLVPVVNTGTRCNVYSRIINK